MQLQGPCELPLGEGKWGGKKVWNSSPRIQREDTWLGSAPAHRPEETLVRELEWEGPLMLPTKRISLSRTGHSLTTFIHPTKIADPSVVV